MTKIAGRGATENRISRRFNLPDLEPDGDWLDERHLIDGAPPKQRTTVIVVKPKTIITYNTSPDVPFTQSINPFPAATSPATVMQCLEVVVSCRCRSHA